MQSYSILEFGRRYYENVAYFNFETNPRLNETFEENISPEYLIPILSHIAGQTIVREKTLIVFDEVQLCGRALTSLKYFCEDAPEYHVIVVGSLLGVAVNRAKSSFPVGKVDMKTLYPMDMEEFMLAMGEQALVEQIKSCFAMDVPLPSAFSVYSESYPESANFSDSVLANRAEICYNPRMTVTMSDVCRASDAPPGRFEIEPVQI